MILFQLIFSLIIALILAFLLAIVMKRSENLTSFAGFFLLIFLAAWAASLWMAPLGPPLFEVYWVPVLIVALIFFLLLASLLPERPRKADTLRQKIEKEQDVEAAAGIFSIFFWLLIVLLVFTIIYRFAFY